MKHKHIAYKAFEEIKKAHQRLWPKFKHIKGFACRKLSTMGKNWIFWTKFDSNKFIDLPLRIAQCRKRDICYSEKTSTLEFFFTYLEIKIIHEIYITWKMMIWSFSIIFFKLFFRILSKISKLKITFDHNTVDACNWYIWFSIH